MLCKIDNIHYGRVTNCTDSTLHGYNIMSIVCTLYGYQDSALNHMQLLPIYTAGWPLLILAGRNINPVYKVTQNTLLQNVSQAS